MLHLFVANYVQCRKHILEDILKLVDFFLIASEVKVVSGYVIIPVY